MLVACFRSIMLSAQLTIRLGLPGTLMESHRAPRTGEPIHVDQLATRGTSWFAAYAYENAEGHKRPAGYSKCCTRKLSLAISGQNSRGYCAGGSCQV